MNWLKTASSMTVYHGSNKKFNAFDLSFAGARDWGDWGIGIYCSTSPTLAEIYAEEAVQKGGGKPYLYKVRANLRNIATEEVLYETIESVGLPINKVVIPGEPQTRPEMDSRQITEKMLELGFDAALRRSGEMVVYDPSALKIVDMVDSSEGYAWL